MYCVLRWNYEGWELEERFKTIEEAEHYIRKTGQDKEHFWIVKDID